MVPQIEFEELFALLGKYQHANCSSPNMSETPWSKFDNWLDLYLFIEQQKLMFNVLNKKNACKSKHNFSFFQVWMTFDVQLKKFQIIWVWRTCQVDLSSHIWELTWEVFLPTDIWHHWHIKQWLNVGEIKISWTPKRLINAAGSNVFTHNVHTLTMLHRVSFPFETDTTFHPVVKFAT